MTSPNSKETINSKSNVNLLFNLPEELQRHIYTFDPTYHLVWRNIFDKSNYYEDGCQHGKWSTCAHPRCKFLLEEGEKMCNKIDEDYYE